MAYASNTDALALIRQTAGGARVASMPGVDWLLAAFARIGLVTLWVDPDSAPSTGNVATTVWLKTSSTSWATEGAVYLWDGDVTAFVAATPELWSRLLASTFAVAREVDLGASKVLTSADAGLLFTNRASPVIEFTLPVASTVDGDVYEFLTTQSGLLTVKLAAGDTQLNWGGDSTTINIAGAQIGAYLKLRSVNGQWFVLSGDGEWLLQ
jgi:hypothetical protein